MAATVSGSKTCTQNAAPNITAAQLTTILAIAVENLTIAQFRTIATALARVPKGNDATSTIGSLLN